MVRSNTAHLKETRQNMRGGTGDIDFTHLLSKDELYSKGRLFSIISIKPGDGIGYHTHTGEMECYYIINGNALYNDNGNEVSLQKGDLTLTRDGEGHSIANNGNDVLEVVALIINN